ncbi:Gfo/Idh/MocA family oxidoreductase [uncultured Alsobacter sp.]|uniref:Gfo/Idh/MocA family protein n=1 Tax=uncultured Alsobacter sp. TaxID=1748258 RepID=UPI0025EF428B|nr:Gfo/Idh/MocA family oxidoreductase [uncultured Alsobacter sp.]
MTHETRIAVAGAGLIGKAHIARILAQPKATLAAIIDPSPAAREQAASLGVPHFAEVEEGLAAAKPDGLVIASPNRFHIPHALAAAAAGVPMLLEKPPAEDVAGARRIVEAAERADVPILVGHHHRHSPLISRARDVIQSGRLGRLTAVNAMSLYKKPDHGYFDGPGAWRREPGGGVVLINLIHLVDDLRNLCGDVVSVQAIESSAARGFPVEDTAAVLLRFANGALGTIILSDSAVAPWSWELTSGENKAYPRTDELCIVVAGTQGSIAVPTLETWSHEGDGWWTPIRSDRIVVPEQDPLTLQMRHFVDVVRREAKPVIDGREGLRTLATTLAVKDAAATGRAVVPERK